jgi:hypothetical protein
LLEADTNTSTGAPAFICIAKVCDAKKEKTTVVPGCAFSKVLPKLVKLSARLDAANTVKVAFWLA